MRDPRARQALPHAINRATINQRSLFGEAKVARSHLGSTLAIFSTDRYGHAVDPAAANALLDEAGARRGANGRPFALRLFWASGRNKEGRSAEIIRDNLRDVGIDVTVQVFDRTSFIERVFRQWDFDLAVELFTAGPNPTVSVTPRYHSNQICRAPFVNGMGYANREVDALFDREAGMTDAAERRRAWHDIQRILMRDLPALPLYELPPIHAASSRFANVATGPPGYIENREDAFEVR